mgnify:CR=1 FL=1
MSISGIGQNYYHNNVATVRNTKNVNSTGKNDGFAGKVTEKNPVSPEDMTLEEYKAYFNEKMNSLYTHPSQRNRNDIIDITDAAYKRMQTDPEYEKKILDALAKNKAVNFGNYIPQISYMHIDDTWEGCYGYTKGMKENDSYTKGISSKHENNVKKKKYITKPMYSRTLLYSIVNVTVEICYDECRGDSNEECRLVRTYWSFAKKRILSIKSKISNLIKRHWR